jgi:hypothetical protein
MIPGRQRRRDLRLLFNPRESSPIGRTGNDCVPVSADEAYSEDEDNEFPGKVKSVDPDKHVLVITLIKKVA